MRKIIWTIAFAGALLSASCTRDDVPAAGMAIAFSADAEGLSAQTRAAAMVETIQTNGYAVGVFAFNSGHYQYGETSVNPNFMYNEKVTYGSGAWTYSPVKYWPNGEGEVSGNTGDRPEYLSFFAYAPYSNPESAIPTDADRCITTFSNQEDAGNPWLIYQIPDDLSRQVDLLFATSQPNLTKPDVNGKVSFNFHHALACIGDQVEVACSGALETEVSSLVEGTVTKAQILLKRVSVTYHLTARARLNLWNTGSIARWEPILNGDQTVDRVVEYGPGTPAVLYSTETGENPSSPWSSYDGSPASEKGVFYIPLDLSGSPQTYSVSVEYFIRTFEGGSSSDGGVIVRTSGTVRLSSHAGAFAPGRMLSVMNITLNP